MKYLHVAVMEDLEECLVSYTEEGLRKQVNDILAINSIGAPTDEEWADCVKGEETTCDVAPDCLPFGVILYYKTESKLEAAGGKSEVSSLMSGVGSQRG